MSESKPVAAGARLMVAFCANTAGKRTAAHVRLLVKVFIFLAGALQSRKNGLEVHAGATSLL